LVDEDNGVKEINCNEPVQLSWYADELSVVLTSSINWALECIIIYGKRKQHSRLPSIV